MSHTTVRLSRRRFLTKAAQGAGLAMTAQFIPGKSLGLDGAVPPSEQIVMGGLGIGSRGGGDPAPGQVKTLKVQYRMDGKPGEVTFPENAPIVLPVPK